MRFNPESVVNLGKRLAYCTTIAALGHVGVLAGPILNNPLKANEVAHGIFVDKVGEEDAYIIRHDLRMTKGQPLQVILDKAYVAIHHKNTDCALFSPYDVTGLNFVPEEPDQNVYFAALVCPSRIAK